MSLTKQDLMIIFLVMFAVIAIALKMDRGDSGQQVTDDVARPAATADRPAQPHSCGKPPIAGPTPALVAAPVAAAPPKVDPGLIGRIMGVIALAMFFAGLVTLAGSLRMIQIGGSPANPALITALLFFGAAVAKYLST